MKILALVLLSLTSVACRSAADAVDDARKFAHATPIALTEDELQRQHHLGAQEGAVKGIAEAQAGRVASLYLWPAALTSVVFFALGRLVQRFLLVRLGRGVASEDTVRLLVLDYPHSKAEGLVRLRKELRAEEAATLMKFQALLELLEQMYSKAGKLDEVIVARTLSMFDEAIRSLQDQIDNVIHQIVETKENHNDKRQKVHDDRRARR